MCPDYLYHYTSIQTLALILSSKKIRFNRLDKVDDLQEAESADLENLGRLFFVSCWSESAEENIPLWSMYTPNMAGIRIKLPSEMFKRFVIEPQTDGFLHVVDHIESPLPYKRMITDQYLVSPTIYNSSQFLKKVTYTGDKKLLCPILAEPHGEGFSYDLGEFGKYKRPEWRFQSEWRFIIMIYPGPFNFRESEDPGAALGQELHSGLIQRSLSFSDFYLDLDDESINAMEVLLGPKTTKGDEIVVRSLLSEYCTNASMKHSNLKGLMR